MLYFLKLGGSLITDKNQAHTARPETLSRLAQEIADALSSRYDLKLVIGHGSGSFGHVAAAKYGTRQGVKSIEDWWGFAEVYREARTLNQIVLEQLQAVGLPMVAFPPSASVISQDGVVQSWDTAPLQAAIAVGMIPLINGDVIFDRTRGGTILSTEELFSYLTAELRPRRILLAGIEAGVWQDFPVCRNLIEKISPQSYNKIKQNLSGATAVDVTGGMAQKVESMLDLVQQYPEMDGLIFSGDQPGLLYQSLLGDIPGTLICKDTSGG